MLYYKTMGTDQIMYCIIALILGMLLANMLKNVCGCKTVIEGRTDPNGDWDPSERLSNHEFLNQFGLNQFSDPRLVACMSYLVENICSNSSEYCTNGKINLSGIQYVKKNCPNPDDT